jgi:hypothetical protein
VPNPDETPQPSPTPPPPRKRDAARGGFREFLGEIRSITDGQERQVRLLAENYRLREKIREARVPEGATVLSAEDAKLFASYKELGTPKAIKDAQGRVENLAGEVARLKRTESYDAAAAALGWKASAFRKLAQQADIEVEPGKVKVRSADGKESEVDTYMVKPSKPDAKPVPLGDYAREHWADFLPALDAKETVAAQRPPVRPGTPPRTAAEPPPRPDMIDAETEIRAQLDTGRYNAL